MAGTKATRQLTDIATAKRFVVVDDGDAPLPCSIRKASRQFVAWWRELSKPVALEVSHISGSIDAPRVSFGHSSQSRRILCSFSVACSRLLSFAGHLCLTASDDVNKTGGSDSNNLAIGGIIL